MTESVNGLFQRIYNIVTLRAFWDVRAAFGPLSERATVAIIIL